VLAIHGMNPDLPPEITVIVEELEAAAWRITWKYWRDGMVEFSAANALTKRVLYVMCSEAELAARLRTL
jgi:hypothetical protein